MRARRASIEAHELDEGLLQWGLRAAAMRVPFLPTRVGLATDVMKVNPEFRTVQSPYADGEVLLAMPALNLDVGSDPRRPCRPAGQRPDLRSRPVLRRAVRARRSRTYASCEELSERLDLKHSADARRNIVERSYITGVVPARFGAHPTSNPPGYGWDMEHLKTYTGLGHRGRRLGPLHERVRCGPRG